MISRLGGRWKNTTLEEALEAARQLPYARIIQLVGKTMPDVFRGEASMLEQFKQTGMLEEVLC